MFERFTKGARDVVTGAVTQAERTSASRVTDEHLLLALLDSRGTRSAFAFASLGVLDRRASVEAGLADARRQGGMSPADTAALAGIGIDVARIVSTVEETHGAGAMRVGGWAKRGWTSHRKFAPEAKKALEQSLRIALGRGDKEISDAHILLALTVRPGVVSEVLADHGATHGALERALFG
ncbi:peptidase [Streptomyces sp. NBC_01498]|uniref:Clp protease N-terminal domain-containing protein n=1 Tax=Streptomyces sp. NBC_01498 TaxID=2975870 RepID=UPI002E7B8112|nr:Clp protease N-terminal domain-containing protein [Streptomyces sp. NBC_01498]WTL24685.1 peptidase [Streptomyces sp. NBC_01498]